uniref:Uncharacterized protein n=1 Tax=Panagrolaimus sp. PS1159 TaxID=55785 RepID=A0AC35GIY3_9BILA
MWKFLIVIALELVVFQQVKSCAGGIGGNGIITNPSLQMTFHPPTAWTYPEATAVTDLSYFPGQSLTQTEAQLRANGDINSAVLAGLQALQLPTTGITVTPQYTPPLVSDCKKLSTSTGSTSQFGYEEGGVITKLIQPGTAAVTPAFCAARNFAGPPPLVMTEFTPIQASAKIDGITLSEYQANLLAAKVSQYLMLNSNVDFTEEMVIN